MTSAKATIVRAQDIMSREVVTIDGMATAREAIAKMRSENVTALLVNKRNPNDAWGIVTIPDLVREVIAPGRSPDDSCPPRALAGSTWRPGAPRSRR